MAKGRLTVPRSLWLTCMTAMLLGFTSGPVLAQKAPSVVARGASDNLAIPHLPFPDNPDPDACGIPTPWGSSEPAWLDGHYQGELVEPIVHLYDSHLRREIIGRAPSGIEVEVILFQDNPTLNYYLVRTVGLEPPQEGWVPAPFLQLEATE